MNTKYQLTDEEKKIEREIDKYVSIKGRKREKIEEILDQTRKNKAISLRIANYDLKKIKEKAEEEGLPYQTLITNILHKYITNQFYEKNEVLKSLRLFKENNAI